MKRDGPPANRHVVPLAACAANAQRRRARPNHLARPNLQRPNHATTPQEDENPCQGAFVWAATWRQQGEQRPALCGDVTAAAVVLISQGRSLWTAEIPWAGLQHAKLGPELSLPFRVGADLRLRRRGRWGR